MSHLSEFAAQLWLVDTTQTISSELWQRYEALLDEQETARLLRLRLERVRRQFLLSRALVRTTLSRYADIAPNEWRFCHNEYGRPDIDPDLNPHQIQFNLSHCDALIACAVTRQRAIGVDVENITRNTSTVAIAQRFFSAQECRALQALPAHAQHERFFDYWTLKESYIKARGMGLALPLGGFSFDLQDPRIIRISFNDKINDNPRRWRFWLLRPHPDQRLALCLEDHQHLVNLKLSSVLPLN